MSQLRFEVGTSRIKESLPPGRNCLVRKVCIVQQIYINVSAHFYSEDGGSRFLRYISEYISR
jgi:hypothetical protein